ncbi:MAG TPA: hypothetical protein VN256_02355 [Pyrinomonadaceae bacterium]|nr:hypothetical protein [Pyrinomonadaceae bacterium]
MIRFRSPLRTAAAVLALLVIALAPARAQSTAAPLTSQELVRLLYELPKNPAKRDEIIEEIRTRGIGFPLTDGLRGVVATKSGNDPLLRRTLEEAERRRLNPAASAPPSPAEAAEVLTKASRAALEAAQTIPDFIVKQLVTRSQAREHTRNWRVVDRLTVAVSYRESAGGEQYKLLAINGLPEAEAESERGSYEQAGGSTTTGEFASLLIRLFMPESETEFKAVDTDTLRGRRSVVYEFAIKKSKALNKLVYGRRGEADRRETMTGMRGRVWIDRELSRVLRVEYTTTEVEPDFPITQLDKTIDFDWVTIGDERYLMPIAAETIFTTTVSVTHYDPRRQMKVTEPLTFQNRNEIRFRNYQKFGAEVKIIEDVGDFEDEPEPEKKP